MPPVQILPGGGPDPYAGQNTQAFMKILQTLGHFEGLRRKRMMQSDILGVISQGGGIEDIAGVVQAHQQPQFDIGLQGLFQRIASPFAQAPGAGITDALTAQALKPQPRTEIQKLTDEDYTPEEAKMIRDISHGLKPRASVRQTYDNMTEIEKLDWLTKLKQRAEGQYYGTEEKIKVREPKVRDWADKELKKLSIYRGEPTGGTFDPEGTGYDSDTAREAGLEPDETGHWGSLDPRTGMLLKGMKHKTIQKTIDVERKLGNKIVKRGKRYYSTKAETQPPVDLQRLGEQVSPWLEEPPTKRQPPVSDRQIKQTYKDVTELRSIMSKLEKEGNTKLYNAIRKKWLAYLEAVKTGREDEESSPSQILEFDEVKAYRK